MSDYISYYSSWFAGKPAEPARFLSFSFPSFQLPLITICLLSKMLLQVP